jgi:head-tail adaptor
MDLAPLHAALDGLDAEIAQADAERAEAEARLRACEHRVQMLQAERTGIASYIRRHEGNQPSLVADSGSEPTNDWIALPRSEAVARVLAETGAPKSPAEIAEALHAIGRDDDYRDVAAALSHLKSRGRAKNVSRGLWALVTETTEDIEGPDPNYEAPRPDDADYERSNRDDDGYWEAIDRLVDQEGEEEEEQAPF